MAARRGLVALVLAAVVWAALWWVVHPPTALHPGSDVYDALTVARHLQAGEGFLNDIVYPVSAAFPFAAKVPQPLVHRAPGHPLLLAAATLGAEEPAAALDRVRLLQILLAGGVAFLGLLMLRRRDLPAAAPLWLAVLFFNPLWDMGVRWCQIEVATALILTAVWLRRGGGVRVGPVDGGLAAATGLLRPELAWLPWLLMAGRNRGGRRRWGLALLTCLTLTAPWLVRNVQVTGEPFFSLQAHAEHRKGLSGQHDSPYALLDAESFPATLARDSGAVLDKALAGLRYQLRRLPYWLPWPLLVAGLVGAGLRRRRDLFRPGAALVLMILLYAPLSHDPRHLMPLLPLLLLELSCAAVRGLGPVGPRRLAAAATTLAVVATLILPARMPGWTASRNAAAEDEARTDRLISRVGALPPGPLMAEDAVVFWETGRAGVLTPARPEDRHRIAEVFGGMDGAAVIEAAP